MPVQVERKSMGEGQGQIFSHESSDRSGATLDVSNQWVACMDILLRDCDNFVVSRVGQLGWNRLVYHNIVQLYVITSRT